MLGAREKKIIVRQPGKKSRVSAKNYSASAPKKMREGDFGGLLLCHDPVARQREKKMGPVFDQEGAREKKIMVPQIHHQLAMRTRKKIIVRSLWGVRAKKKL